MLACGDRSFPRMRHVAESGTMSGFHDLIRSRRVCAGSYNVGLEDGETGGVGRHLINIVGGFPVG